MTSSGSLLRMVGAIGRLAIIQPASPAIAGAAELQFRSLADGAPALVWANGIDGCEFVNREYLEFLGVSVREVRGYDWAQFIHPDDRAGYVDAYRQALSKETFFEAEFRFRRHDGQYRWMRSVGRPRYNGRHEFLGYSGLTLDITEQKNAEMALRESERALAAEVAAMARMQEISTRLLQADDFSALLDDILAAAIDLSGADMGNVQLVQEGALKIAAQRGFEAPFLDFFNNVQGLAACGKALETRERVIVEDVARSPIFVGTPALQVMLAAQARAVQSTPLISRSGRLLGMLSTHYRTTQKPGEHQLRLLDVLSRQAADLTERAQSEIQLRCKSSRLDTLNDMAKLLLQDLDLGRIVQTVTDKATELSGAKFGAFFYNVGNPNGESYLLYALSGAPREAFDRFGVPRNTALFEPTFRGTAIVRSADIRKDPRYGKNAPHYGMPDGHLPVVSYLAVPVVSRTGEVHGGLFFGHDRPGAFSEETERIISGVAAHAAIAIDNAQLYEGARRHVSIVDASNDAIISKDLSGVITSWNTAAERMFGYSAVEAIGKPVTMLVPSDQQSEEDQNFARIRRGQRVEPYETVRRRKDGTLIDLALTVSPVRDGNGRVVGSSKIARDITDRKRAEERERLLAREVQHRTRNLFSVVQAVVARSFDGKATVRQAKEAVLSRLLSLSQTHFMLMGSDWQGADIRKVVSAEAAPYGDRMSAEGPDLTLNAEAAENFALALHELATNATKYGALSNPTGCVHISWRVDEAGKFTFQWREQGGPTVVPPISKGFGSTVLEQVLGEYFEGVQIDFAAEGLRYEFVGPVETLAARS